MERTHTWEISDELWTLVEPLIPTFNEVRDKMLTCQRKTDGDRKRKYSDRTFFAVIVYVLRTKFIRNAIPHEKFGRLDSIPRRCINDSNFGRKPDLGIEAC